MLIEQQIAERRVRAQSAIAKVLERPRGGPYGDYRVQSASGKTYRVAMRGPGLFENYCSCPDFEVNTLGTCKHIEGLLLVLRQRHGEALGAKRYKRTRASISLQYGETIEVRLRLPAAPLPALEELARQYFDPTGCLRRVHFRGFHHVLEAFRKADPGRGHLQRRARLRRSRKRNRGRTRDRECAPGETARGPRSLARRP